MYALLLTALLFIILDFIWFKYSFPRYYGPTFASIQGHEMQLKTTGGIFAWLLLAFGIRYFVTDKQKSANDNFLKGAIFGFVVYGIYNGTNYATLSNYNWETFVADLIWGSFVSGTVSYISWFF